MKTCGSFPVFVFDFSDKYDKINEWKYKSISIKMFLKQLLGGQYESMGNCH